MSFRSTLVLATAAFALAAPLAAQDGPALPPLEISEGTYAGAWEGSWDENEVWDGRWQGTYTDRSGRTIAADYEGTFIGESRFLTQDGRELVRDSAAGWREGSSVDREATYAPHLAYTAAQRNAWLADCRVVMLGDAAYYDDDRREGGDSDLIGGLIGAAAGGLLGNRIADGDRLLGTVIGAGAGGLAGAVIGSEIDRNNAEERGEQRRWRNAEEVYAADYCEAYLQRYEAGAYGGAAYAPQITYVTRSASGAHDWPCAGCSETIEEEWIEEEAAPAPRRRHRRAMRVVEPDKRLPLR